MTILNSHADFSLPSASTGGPAPLLLAVEGINDLAFLRRLSAMLHAHDRLLPDLGDLERQGVLLTLPLGGGGLAQAVQRLAPLNAVELHIYDRELPPETERRQQMVEALNRRPHCRAFLTRKRSLENYLHPAAIAELDLPELEIEDFISVPQLVARQLHRRSLSDQPWELLPYPHRKRLLQLAKRLLNTIVVENMTVERLQERDPDGEIIDWLRTAQRMLEGR